MRTQTLAAVGAGTDGRVTAWIQLAVARQFAEPARDLGWRFASIIDAPPAGDRRAMPFRIIGNLRRNYSAAASGVELVPEGRGASWRAVGRRILLRRRYLSSGRSPTSARCSEFGDTLDNPAGTDISSGLLFAAAASARV